jgi:2-polyprenyl-3-methyl-5-hydroxy-6-metoxy-1,4-benzoquinol methylase
MSQDAESAWTIDEITDRGERVVHLRMDEGFYDHLSIYHFASQYCTGRTVLDAGSGTGYGAAYLADQGAERVYGIDISPKSIAFSQTHFQRPNLEFHVMNLAHISGFPHHSFDVITSSNALEHISNISAFLRSAWELLNPQGIMSSMRSHSTKCLRRALLLRYSF